MAGVAHGEKGKRKYSQNGAYGNDKPQFLAHDAEHGVRIAGKGVFKPAVSGSLAEKAARCAGGKGVRLLAVGRSGAGYHRVVGDTAV